MLQKATTLLIEFLRDSFSAYRVHDWRFDTKRYDTECTADALTLVYFREPNRKYKKAKKGNGWAYEKIKKTVLLSVMAILLVAEGDIWTEMISDYRYRGLVVDC